MRRIGIFVFYDKYGIVNDYVKYLLEQMTSLLSEICIACNGYITDESRKWLNENSDYIFFRENEGYDGGAYQDVILNGLGLSKLREFDKLVLFNNSFYGPIFSFEDMFEEMEKRKVDFWGITAYGGEFTPHPYHIQSYFLVIEDNLLRSNVFEEYWRQQKRCDTFHNTVDNFELQITDFFRTRGFSCSTYIDYFKTREKYEIEANLLNAVNYELLVDMQCPVLKRKYIMQPVGQGLVQNTADIIQLVKEKTKYDAGLIWNDLINEHSPYNLFAYRNLNNYLTDCDCVKNESTGLDDVCIVIDSVCPGQFIQYLEKELHDITVIVFTDEELAENEKAMILKKNGQSMEQLLISARRLKHEAQYFCVLKDSVISRVKVTERRRNYNICKKLSSSVQYIKKVKKLFEQQSYLGALFTEELFDADFLAQGFYKHYLSENQAELLERIGCYAKAGEQLINHAGCFWINVKVLETIEKMGISRNYFTDQESTTLFPYFVKAAGYYSGMLYNVDFMAKEHLRKDILLNELIDNIVFFNEEHIKKQILGENILSFSQRFQKIYIYGAGSYAKRAVYFFERKEIPIEGIIVTHKKLRSEFMGYPLKEINEVQFNEKTGIIVAMSERNQHEIKGLLKCHLEENIYYV